MSAQAAPAFSATDARTGSPNDREGELIAARYRITRQLGQGGAATVFQAVDLSTERSVALKRLRKPDNKRLLSLFELEFYTLASIKHPNVVSVYEYGADPRGPYYTMELLEGADLNARGAVPFQEAAQYICEAAAALGRLHARRLVHRDVSPRNLWRTPDGQIKVIDFGALTAFGIARYVVGTPPCIPPEALGGQALDQRSDLYALGASFYWLMTGTHAYGARQLHELRSVWQEPLTPPSKRLRARNLPELPEIPPEIDVLVEALLSHSPDARPTSTGDLIDRLSAFTKAGESSRSDALELTLQQGAFVGREREKRYFRRRVQAAKNGEGSLSILEGRPGEGRSRLLSEFAFEARLSGADVIRVDSKLCAGPRGVVETMLLRLLAASPESAKAAFAPQAAALALISPAIGEKLGVPSGAPPDATIAGELRARIHNGLREGVAALTREGCWVILVDDLEAADEASVAALLALCELTNESPLLLVLSVDIKSNDGPTAAIKALRSTARSVALSPFDARESQALVRSLFGEAPQIDRLADRLHRAARGVPGRLMETARHLVRTDVVTYRDGTWVLPQDIDDEQLQTGVDTRISQQLLHLSSQARTLVDSLCIHRGLIPLEHCKVLSGQEPHELFSSLEELVQHEVLVGQGDAYGFASERLRLRLLAQADGIAKREAHVRLGRALLTEPEATDLQRLEGAVHVLHGDDNAEALEQLTRLGIQFAMAEPDQLSPAVPAMEQAVQLLRSRGKSDQELLPLLGPLAVAGYFFDRRLAARYGEHAVRALNAALGLDLARRLRPWLGAKVSLLVGLIAGGIGFARRKKNPSMPTFRDATLLFFNCVGALMGTASICIDPAGVARCARLIEPWTALGKKHLTSFVHRFTINILTTVQDRSGLARERWHEILKVLRDPAQCAALPEALHLRYLGGALYACGALDSLRDDGAALDIAEELSRFEIQMYHLSADQLRTSYYANQGNLELFERYRRRAEMHAIQRGSAWQAETWGLGAAITVYQRTHDAMGLKHCYEQLSRLAREVPSLALLARRCRGAYLLVRERYSDALPHLERCLEEEPLGVIGWGRAHGALAACLNGLGEHERASQICSRALSALDPKDLEFTAMNLGLEIQAIVADAGLGRPAQAKEKLDALFARYRQGASPLTLGALHETKAQLSLLEVDQEECLNQLDEVKRLYESTAIPSLVARATSLTRRFRRELVQKAQASNLPQLITPDSVGSAHASMSSSEAYVLDRGVNTQTVTRQTFSEEALRIVVRKSRAEGGGLWGCTGAGARLLAMSGKSELPSEIRNWAEERVLLIRDDVTQTDCEEATDDPDFRELNGNAYQFILLTTLSEGKEQTVGGIVLQRSAEAGLFRDHPLLRAVAEKIREEVSPD